MLANQVMPGRDVVYMSHVIRVQGDGVSRIRGSIIENQFYPAERRLTFDLPPNEEVDLLITYAVPCPSCQDGRVICSNCQGNGCLLCRDGTRTCDTCEGMIVVPLSCIICGRVPEECDCDTQQS